MTKWSIVYLTPMFPSVYKYHLRTLYCLFTPNVAWRTYPPHYLLCQPRLSTILHISAPRDVSLPARCVCVNIRSLIRGMFWASSSKSPGAVIIAQAWRWPTGWLNYRRFAGHHFLWPADIITWLRLLVCSLLIKYSIGSRPNILACYYMI